MEGVSKNIPVELCKLKGVNAIRADLLNIICGIYFLCKDGEIQYIGKSVNILQRVLSHKTTRRIKFNQVFFIECAFSELDTLEPSLTRCFQPSKNIRFKHAATDADKDIVNRISEINFVA